MGSQTIGYIRVSTREQSTGRQSTGMEHLKLDKIFTEKASAKSKERPELLACIAYAREGDHLHVYSIDRLARNLNDLQEIVQQLIAKGVTVHFIKDNLIYSPDTASPVSTMLLQVLGAFAQFERNIMLERQAEGIAHAKAHGTKTGRPFGTQPLDMTRRPEAIEYSKMGMNISQIAKAMNLSRPSIYKLLS